MRPATALAALLALAAAPAGAADYRAAPESRLGFRAVYMGDPFEGRFAEFGADIRFDPAAPAGCRFAVDIALASADTQNEERDGMLAGPDFFDTGAQPRARYLAERCRAAGGGRFVAEGVLTLRGVEKPVALDFGWTPGERPVLDGRARLRRLDFGVGGGDWTDTDLLPDDVTVETRLVLVPSA